MDGCDKAITEFRLRSPESTQWAGVHELCTNEKYRIEKRVRAPNNKEAWKSHKILALDNLNFGQRFGRYHTPFSLTPVQKSTFR